MHLYTKMQSMSESAIRQFSNYLVLKYGENAFAFATHHCTNIS